MIFAPQAPDRHTVMLPASCSAKGEIGLNPLEVAEFAPIGAAALLGGRGSEGGEEQVRDRKDGWVRKEWWDIYVLKLTTKHPRKNLDLQNAEVGESSQTDTSMSLKHMRRTRS